MDLLIMLYLTLCFSFPAPREASNASLVFSDNSAVGEAATATDNDALKAALKAGDDRAADKVVSEIGSVLGPGEVDTDDTKQVDPIVGSNDVDGAIYTGLRIPDNGAGEAGEQVSNEVDSVVGPDDEEIETAAAKQADPIGNANIEGDAADELTAVEPQALEDTPEDGPVEKASSAINPDNPDLSTE
eukprot:NODE_1535_length_883_cov_0.215561.p1 type:complete len:187 gc:universal NODE_1535_length_883_cov_0.215561:183-743(+)